MRILRRYILTRFLQTYFLALLSMIGIYLIIDIFERMDEFVSHNASFSEFFLYYLYKVPFIGYFMGPQAILLATVITLAAMAQNNELTAIKACGVSLTGITLPILTTSLIIAMLLILANEFITPVTSEKMNYIYNVKVRGKAHSDKIQRFNLWLRSPTGAIWNIGFYNPDQSSMKNVSLFYYDEKSLAITRRIDATEVIWNGKNWEFLNGYFRAFKSGELANTRFFENENFAVVETPNDFKKIQKRPEEMSMREMFKKIQLEQAEGIDTSKQWVDLHKKISYPCISVVLALIGIPLSLRTSRNGGVLFSTSISLGVGFIFSFFYAMGISLGYGGTFGPVLASWGPSLLFVCIGFYLILTIDSEKLLPI